MVTAPGLISLEEYMNTSYSPDCECIDGVVTERNVGKGRHPYTSDLDSALWELAGPKGAEVLPPEAD